MEEPFLLFSDKKLLFHLHNTYGFNKIIVTKNSATTFPIVPELFDEADAVPGHGSDATLLRKITEDIQKKLISSQQCLLSFTKYETVYNLSFNS